jgi:hypothetical protein
MEASSYSTSRTAPPPPAASYTHPYHAQRHVGLAPPPPHAFPPSSSPSVYPPFRLNVTLPGYTCCLLSSLGFYLPIESLHPVLLPFINLLVLIIYSSIAVFPVLFSPAGYIGELAGMVEMQVWDAYKTKIQVLKLQDKHSIDLPPSYTVGSLLADDAAVFVDYRRVQVTGTMRSPELQRAQQPIPGTAGSFHAHPGSAVSTTQDVRSYAPIPTTTTLETSVSPSQQKQAHSNPQPAQPSSASPSTLYSANIEFIEGPPTKVIQNKEFSFTVSTSALVPKPHSTYF